MNENVINLHDGISLAEASEEVVKLLERLLEMAKSGEIDGMALAASHADGSATSCWLGCSSHSMLGALVRVQAHIMREMDE